MKRGLVTLDHAAIGEQEWADRLDALRDRLRREGLSAALVYGDVHRSDDIAYLTNLCIYWNEGILAVPADGTPAFLTKLSKRVHPWMRRTSLLDDLRSGRSLGALVAAFLAEHDDGRRAVGVVDAGWWPAPLLAEVAGQAAGWELRPLPDAVRDLRVVPSRAELELLGRAGRVLAGAVEAAAAAGADPRPRAAAVERAARGAGFTDLRVHADRAGDAFCVDAVGQYRNGWVRAGRAAGGGASGRVTDALTGAAARLSPGRRPSALPAPDGVRVECVAHADLATEGAHRALADPDAPIADGAVVALRAEAQTPEGRLTASDTYLVRAGGAARLTDRRLHADLG